MNSFRSLLLALLTNTQFCHSPRKIARDILVYVIIFHFNEVIVVFVKSISKI